MRTADPVVSFAAVLHQQQSDIVKGQESEIFYFFIHMYIHQRIYLMKLHLSRRYLGLNKEEKGVENKKIRSTKPLFIISED